MSCYMQANVMTHCSDSVTLDNVCSIVTLVSWVLNEVLN
jgi:hypothetical protein